MASSTTLPAATNRPAALVSGAGFAGLATAFELNRLGYLVTVVEVAPALRRGGTPVDIEGETIDILARMGLLDAVRACALPPRSFEFKDADDVTLGEMGGAAAAEPNAPAPSRFEIHRDDLLDVLFGAVANVVEMRFGRSIRQLDEHPDGVVATLDDGSEGRFALVFGCDGARSQTRQMVFGEHAAFTHFMGGYFLLKVTPETGFLPANRSQLFSTPGRAALLNGYDDRTDIGFAFRSKVEIACDHRDRPQQRRLICERFVGMGWKIPAMLASVIEDDDFYFAGLQQIRMPCWSRGRMALVGDAGYCVSPLAGFGGSMAIIGAGRLGEALARHPGDFAAAFRTYEEGLRPFAEEVQQRAATQGLAMMFPADEAELEERDRRLASGEIGL